MNRLLLIVVLTLIFLFPISLHAVELTCGAVLTTPGTYTLREDLTCDTGVLIKGNDIILDCSCLFGRATLKGSAMSTGEGIVVRKARRTRIINCVVDGWERGVVIEKSQATSLHGVTVQQNAGDGLTVSKSKDSHITVFSVRNEGWGVVVEDSRETTLMQSAVNNNGDGSLLVLNPRGTLATFDTVLDGDMLVDK